MKIRVETVDIGYIYYDTEKKKYFALVSVKEDEKPRVVKLEEVIEK